MLDNHSDARLQHSFSCFCHSITRAIYMQSSSKFPSIIWIVYSLIPSPSLSISAGCPHDATNLLASVGGAGGNPVSGTHWLPPLGRNPRPAGLLLPAATGRVDIPSVGIHLGPILSHHVRRSPYRCRRRDPHRHRATGPSGVRTGTARTAPAERDTGLHCGGSEA